MTPTFVAPDGALSAPERNRFFYGKLMDVAEFEKEQAYFRRQQALTNRLATGWGVLAGLNLTAVAGKSGFVNLEPGAALDGAGRLIVVPEAVEIDAHQGTDSAGNPSGAPLASGLVSIALSFAEGCDCVVLENHGVVTGGGSLQEAFERFETLEFTAKTIIKARLLGDVRYLTDVQIAAYSKNAAYGIGTLAAVWLLNNGLFERAALKAKAVLDAGAGAAGSDGV